jgi:hypothetical protein
MACNRDIFAFTFYGMQMYCSFAGPFWGYVFEAVLLGLLFDLPSVYEVRVF